MQEVGRQENRRTCNLWLVFVCADFFFFFLPTGWNKARCPCVEEPVALGTFVMVSIAL